MIIEKYLVKDEKNVVMVLIDYKMATEVADLLYGDTYIKRVIGMNDNHISLQALLFSFWNDVEVESYIDNKMNITFYGIDMDSFDTIVQVLKLYGYKFEYDMLERSIVVYDI